MIPVEFFWIALIVVFGVIGAARGLLKELGATTILLLSLFVLKFGWKEVGSKILEAIHGRAPNATDAAIMAAYYSLVIIFVAYISYEGVVLSFPVKQLKGPAKAIFGFFGGLLNGYLIIGTIWDVVAQANYFGLQVQQGTGGKVEIASYLTQLHQDIVQFLPVSFMNEFVMLILGMILLLAIVLK
jgi:uncharacterized membrane protein required for colicin V production